MTMMAQAPAARLGFPAQPARTDQPPQPRPADPAGPAVPAVLAEPAEPAEPAGLRHRRVRLLTDSVAAAHAAGHVQAAIVEWNVPVDRGLAGVLASDLIINAVTNGTGKSLMLSISCSASQFRVEIHDPSVTGDSWETAEADLNAERGLLLAAALAIDFGHYRTPAGRAVYYALAFAPEAATGDGNSQRGATRGDGEP